MKKFILSALVLGAPFFANAFTVTIVCEDGSTHQRETVTPDYFEDQDDAEDFYMEFADLVCAGKA